MAGSLSGPGQRPSQGEPSPVGATEPGSEQRLSGALRAVEHAAVWAERPIRRLAGSARLNPLPHAGTISVFLVGLVVVTGLYITLFFEFGHEASYRSVSEMEEHAIQQVVRALHRYASAALVLTTVVHGWRIFAAGRFTGRLRRWRWATGVAALILVWLAGVTGYWLVWDVRAQGLNEITLGLFGWTGSGVSLAVDQMGVVGNRSGSGFLLLIWFAHVLLTVAIIWFAWRHLRRTKQPWLPPPHWMALMGIPLVLVSIALPVGMLAPADPEALIGEVPIDPFVLFLLPPLLSSWRWVTVAIVAVVGLMVLMLPRLLRRRDPEIISVIEDDCTGCELCVADCPYDALHMVDRHTGLAATKEAVDHGSSQTGDDEADPASGRRDLLAVVDPARCVSCGVCLGSCAFGAIELPGAVLPPPLHVAGRPLVIACDRHVDDLHTVGSGEGSGDGGEEPVIYPVRCAGALAPGAIRSFAELGASDIQLVGCAPNDCRYGIGNSLAAERMAGERRPHPPSRYARRVTQDWVDGDRVVGALAHPGEHPELDTSHPPARREALIGVAVIALLTAVGVALATRAPFGQRSEDATLRVVVDHEAGQALAADPESRPLGSIERVEVRLSAGPGDPVVTLVDGPTGTDHWAEIIEVDDLDLDPTAEASLTVVVDTSGGSVTVVDGPVEAVGGRRVVVDLTDRALDPGAEEGRRIFDTRDGGCSVCHSVDEGDDGVGPTLFGVATAADSRVAGLDAEGYLRQSILLPDQYVLDGWPAGQMLPIYRDRFSDDELEAVIAYLLTLEDTSMDDPESSEGSDE